MNIRLTELQTQKTNSGLLQKIRFVCKFNLLDHMKYLKFEAHTYIVEKWYFYQFMLQENN